MEWIRLIGIAIIVVGFILKFDTIATVVLAGLVTALVSGVSLVEFLEILGKEFSN
ncbi:permease [Streptococcus pneumoniae]|nr:permease [Streptococcus pneumoniae]CJQ50033.1 permease [Streptococcus pneumoniae]CJX80079.1 permease [Streptococcus pneumoniae]